MDSRNSVLFEGFLGTDPELLYTTNQVPYRKIWVTRNDKYKDKQGAERETHISVNTTIWRKQAEDFDGLKGDRVLIRGKLRTNEYQNKKYLEVSVTNIDVVWKKQRQQPLAMNDPGLNAPQDPPPPDDDDLPF